MKLNNLVFIALVLFLLNFFGKHVKINSRHLHFLIMTWSMQIVGKIVQIVCTIIQKEERSAILFSHRTTNVSPKKSNRNNTKAINNKHQVVEFHFHYIKLYFKSSGFVNSYSEQAMQTLPAEILHNFVRVPQCPVIRAHLSTIVPWYQFSLF